jgi:hypothetical protein
VTVGLSACLLARETLAYAPDDAGDDHGVEVAVDLLGQFECGIPATVAASTRQR